MNDLLFTLKQLKELASCGGSIILLGWEAQALLDERDALRNACETLVAACDEQSKYTRLPQAVGKALDQAETALFKGAKHE